MILIWQMSLFIYLIRMYAIETDCAADIQFFDFAYVLSLCV